MAKILSVSRATLVNYESGKHLPDIDFLATLSGVTSTKLTELIKKRLASTDAGITDHVADELEGNLLDAVTKGTAKRDDVVRFVRDLAGADSALASDLATLFPERNDLAEIPLYNVRVSAGSGSTIEDERVIGARSFQKAWIVDRLKMNPADLALVVVHGTSMEPTLSDGDLLMVNLAQNRLGRDDIYLLRDGDDVTVKRLQKQPGDRFRIISDNPHYPPMDLHRHVLSDGTFAIIGRVVWWAHTNAG